VPVVVTTAFKKHKKESQYIQITQLQKKCIDLYMVIKITQNIHCTIRVGVGEGEGEAKFLSVSVF
jgi:hypothetical protein